MAKPIKWSENKIRQFQAEGRGKGKLATYIPWVQVTDFSSKGESRRVFSPKTGRVHHLLSTVEWHLFLLLEFAEDVIDIREQFPLDRDDTLSIAAELCIKHPIYPGTKIPEVMTCDFLVIRRKDTGECAEAFNCKRTEEAENARSLEKLEIQRRYFDGMGTSHHLVFHSRLPKSKIKNLEWIRSAQTRQDEVEPFPGYFDEHAQRVLSDLTNHSRSGSVSDFCDNYDSRNGALPGTGLRAVRILLLNRDIQTDLNEPNLAAAPISMFRTNKKLRLVAKGK